MQPVLYLMLGYPGSGKTTTALKIKELTGAEHIWADVIRREMFGHPNPDYSLAENTKLYDHLNKVAESLLAEGKSVIYDTNFNFFKDREHMRQIAARTNAKTVLIWVQTDQETARQRATNTAQPEATRALGNMPVKEFDRMAHNLRPPLPGEQFIAINGQSTDPNHVQAQLGL